MFTRLYIPVLFGSLLFISGCGINKTISTYFDDVDNIEPPAALVEFTETADITRIWSQKVGQGSSELFIKLSPALLDTQIFTADTAGNIVALDTASGKTIWKNNTELPVSGGLGADASLILIGTSEGEILALSLEGREVWRSRVSSEILSPPGEANGIVVVRTIDGKLFALDALTGDRLWVYDRTVPALTLRGTSAPVIADNRVIAGFDGGRVAALELKTGKLIWEQRVAVSSGRSELERMIDIDAPPLIVDDIIYVSTFQANISALSLESGQIFWQRDISSYSELATDGHYLFITDEQSHVWAVDRFSGASIWEQEKLQARHATGPTVAGNKLIVGDLEGYLHWLDKDTGQLTARNRVSKGSILTPAITQNDRVYAYSTDATLAAFSYADNALATPEQVTPEEKKVGDAKADPAVKAENNKASLFDRLVDIVTGDGEEAE